MCYLLFLPFSINEVRSLVPTEYDIHVTQPNK